MLGMLSPQWPRVTFQREREIWSSLVFHLPSAMGQDSGGSGCALHGEAELWRTFRRPQGQGELVSLACRSRAPAQVCPSPRSIPARQRSRNPGSCRFEQCRVEAAWPCPAQTPPGLQELGWALLPQPGVLLQEGSGTRVGEIPAPTDTKPALGAGGTLLGAERGV